MKKLVRKYESGNSLSGGGKSTTQSGVQKFMNSKSGAIYSGVVSEVGNTASMIGQATQLDKTYNSNDALAEGLRDSASDALLSSGNPYAMAAGATIKVVGATGGFTDGTKGLGTGNDVANTIASMAIPGAGWFVKKLPDYHESQELKETSSYGQTQAQAEKVGGFAGSKALFGRNKAKRLISEQKIADAKVSDIINTGKEDYYMASSMSDYNTNQYNMDINGGWNRKVSVGKKGMKLGFDLDDENDPTDYLAIAKQIMSEPMTFEIQKFKDGGQMNVIPEGSLHARKHHMENDENITKKGIPVVDNDGEQQAEIELNEIIFTKEVTQKLEEYWKDGSDEAAIKAGKLIAKEIMENTDDRTGLIETID